MKKAILLIFLSISINLTAQKYSKRGQLKSANHWLNAMFESNYSNVKLDPYSHKISFTTTIKGYKQFYDNVYLDIEDDGNSWTGRINMFKAVWKSFENYSSDREQIEFNSNGFMTKHVDFNGFSDEFDAKFYSGNSYSEEQRQTTRYEGNVRLEKPYRIFLKREDYNSNKFYFINYDFNENKYAIYDQNEQLLMSLDLVNDELNGSFDYSLYGIREVGTYKIGELDGEYVKYDINGNKILEGKYKKGKRIGKWLELTSDFELSRLVYKLCDISQSNFNEILNAEEHFNEYNYNSEEYIMGLVNMNYKTGERLGSYYYNEDDYIVYGKFELFYKNGNLFCKGEYNQNGDLKRLEIFGKSSDDFDTWEFHTLFKSGELKYYKDGILYLSEEYKNYKRNGNRITYFEKGEKIFFKWSYNNGRLDQRFLYYKNGQIDVEWNHKNGKKHGLEIGYYENGAIFYKKKWINGVSDGDVVYYNEDGSIEK